jgi:hypothetical protein
MFLPLHIKNVYQFIYTKNRVTDDRMVNSSLQNCRFSIRALLHGTQSFMVMPTFLENLCNSTNSILYQHWHSHSVQIKDSGHPSFFVQQCDSLKSIKSTQIPFFLSIIWKTRGCLKTAHKVKHILYTHFLENCNCEGGCFNLYPTDVDFWASS